MTVEPTMTSTLEIRCLIPAGKRRPEDAGDPRTLKFSFKVFISHKPADGKKNLMIELDPTSDSLKDWILNEFTDVLLILFNA